MINIVVPMAGEGSRFAKEGYEKPKPFIDIKGQPMISRVLRNLSCPDARFILIARKDHLAREKALSSAIEKDFNATFLPIDLLTEGTACTVLFAREYINNEQPLLIANSDQIVDVSMASFVEDCFSRHLDGSIMTFTDPTKNPKWSFAKTDKEGIVTECKEKVPISDLATVGIYFFSQGKTFVDAAIDMIARNERVNGEFYTCPTYNHAIASGRKFGIYSIDQKAMHGIGTPDDLKSYVETL